MLGIATNWIMFFAIARVILVASKNKAKQTGDSNIKMRTVSIIRTDLFVKNCAVKRISELRSNVSAI